MDLGEGVSGSKPQKSPKSLEKVSQGRVPKVCKKSRKRSEKSPKNLKMGFLDYDPGDHLKRCRSPNLEKCRRSASESAGPKRGAEGSAEKSAPGSVSETTFTERRNPEHSFRHFPRHLVSGRHFPKHFFGTFQVGASAPL